MQDAMELVDVAIQKCLSEGSSEHMVNALRALQAGADDTRRLAIDRIERHLKTAEGSRELVNLIIALRRAGQS